MQAYEPNGMTDEHGILAPSAGAWGSRAVGSAREAGAIYDMHYALELGIVLKGRSRRHYSSWQMDVGPGQVWLCGVWERHGRTLLETPCERVAVFASPVALTAMSREVGAGMDWMAPFKVPPCHRPQAHGEMREELLALGQRAGGRMSDESDSHRGLWSMLFLIEALLTLSKSWQPPALASQSAPRETAAVSEAIAMVFATTGLVTVQAAAQACGMNRNSFSRYFRQFTGIRFADFALRHRLSGAAQQLVRTDDPVKAVAREWGFSHVSHLHRCFLRHYGCSPAAYRRVKSWALGEEQTGPPVPAESKSTKAR